MDLPEDIAALVRQANANGAIGGTRHPVWQRAIDWAQPVEDGLPTEPDDVIVQKPDAAQKGRKK